MTDISNQPLNRVKVTLESVLDDQTMSGTAGVAPSAAVTDDNGQFELAGVPAGTYRLKAARPGFLAMEFGQPRPRQHGRTIHVNAGDRLDGLAVALPLASMLSGTVVTAQGDPIAGAVVEALDFRPSPSRSPAVPSGRATTNDVGEFLIGGLLPGDYLVRAKPPGRPERTTSEALDSGNSPTFYPGTPNRSQASSIALALGQEVSGLIVPLVRSSAARIVGYVETAGGQRLPGMTVNLYAVDRLPDGDSVERATSLTAESTADGTFEIARVPPGEYIVRTAVSSAERASQLVAVSGLDVSVVLRPRFDAVVEGTITADDATAPPFDARVVRVLPVAVDGRGDDRPVSPVSSRDFRFRIADWVGPHLLRVEGLPAGWNLKAVRMNGIDITEQPFEPPSIEDGVTRLEVIVTPRTTALEGEVRTAAGTAASEGLVVVFSSDASSWGVASRAVRTGEIGPDGRFAVRGLLPGTYFVAAQDVVLDREWEDALWLADLRAAAITISVTETETPPLPLVLGVRR
ncbi:MAG TPA: carboxypeptidase regulatory-like domain-containing protein [Vicinamibacterales bacterium]|nr:carboxypeptidase regulatory-like domain-containing protein [Vicinamibacterales bacterium]